MAPSKEGAADIYCMYVYIYIYTIAASGAGVGKPYRIAVDRRGQRPPAVPPWSEGCPRALEVEPSEPREATTPPPWGLGGWGDDVSDVPVGTHKCSRQSPNIFEKSLTYSILNKAPTH